MISPDNTGTLEIGQRCIDAQRSQLRARDEVVCGGEWMQLEQIVNAKRGTRPVAFRRNVLPIPGEEIGDLHDHFESLVRFFRHAVEGEFEPRLAAPCSRRQ